MGAMSDQAVSVAEFLPTSSTTPGEARGWRPTLHPYALAVFPVLTIWAGIIREVTLGDGLAAVLFMASIAAVVLWLFRLVIRHDQRAARAVTFVLTMVLSYGSTCS